jgi:phosphatidylglycerol:prolipoprotein diacylglycerol transferase
VERVEPQALVATAWFDSGEGTEPYAATVRFTGRRIGSLGPAGSRDTFVQDETISEIVPGTGPVSITTWVYGLRAGEWIVDGEVIVPAMTAAAGGMARTRPGRGRPAHPARWSWRRWAVSTRPDDRTRTRWAVLAPLVTLPAVLPGIYTALAILSIIVAVAVQSAILARGDVPVSRSLLASGVTIVAGLIGAKVWYAVLHPWESIIRGGWAVDGFLIVLPSVGAVTLLLLDLPIGVVLDATAPGLFLAVAIGRIGCFFTGCCAGRPTNSRWGVWSSDRRVGARRVPSQLLESGTGLVIGGATLALALGGTAPVPGATFVLSFAAYTIVRQVLLRLRSERRKSPRTVPLTAAATGAVVAAAAVVSVLQVT